ILHGALFYQLLRTFSRSPYVLELGSSNIPNTVPMRQALMILSLLLVLQAIAAGQTINFSDLSLKDYLVHELCVDTTHSTINFSNDLPVDLNGDGEIQESEALAVEWLALEDFSDEYSISAIQDLNFFPNLRYLKIWSLDSLLQVSDLALDSLQWLWVADCVLLRTLDISNLPGITASLRIEGLTKLDSLNIQNGSVADQFSLFYTIGIKHACIDDIPAEYDAFDVFGAMLPGVLPSTNCGLVHTEQLFSAEEDLKIYPNPSAGDFYIETDQPVLEIQVLNAMGQVLFRQNTGHRVKLSSFPAGSYFLRIKLADKIELRKIYRN
ncbi:MAG: T9SS type A sorting domain-containing protein, partial [Saprospiraceae bacterium]|nr:T9SS type A sorting domain-containing protein [Saprospiraceae bacterium]